MKTRDKKRLARKNMTPMEIRNTVSPYLSKFWINRKNQILKGLLAKKA